MVDRIFGNHRRKIARQRSGEERDQWPEGRDDEMEAVGDAAVEHRGMGHPLPVLDDV